MQWKIVYNLYKDNNIFKCLSSLIIIYIFHYVFAEISHNQILISNEKLLYFVLN